jgi:energy-coupling factor transporter ATP-binding protein EcfA2
VKLAKVSIENFRHLGTTSRPFEVSFTDVLGRVHDVALLVGPNGSGKTTLLDAIAAALGPSLGMPSLRTGFSLSPRRVVRRGAPHARVSCWLRFSPDEMAATRELLQLVGRGETLQDTPEIKVTWTYPDPRKPSGAWVPTRADGDPQGVTQYEPEGRQPLLTGRLLAAQLLSTGRAGGALFERFGGLFTFDQDRTGLGKIISRQVWNLIHGTTEAAREHEDRRSSDPRTILIDLALRSLVPAISSTGQPANDFERIQELYAQFYTRRLLGVVKDELGEFDVAFTDGKNEHTYEGLSGGEKAVLEMLIRFVVERIRRSVVLIDELELHQHPIWQRRLLYVLSGMGDDNQIIATTHSDYLRDAVRPDAVINLEHVGVEESR